MSKKKKRKRKHQQSKTKPWHVWGRLVRVHKDKRKYNRKKKYEKGEADD